MWRSSAAQHSQSLESWYAHIPGLVVVCPFTPGDNYSLLRAAIRCDDPVVYMEHKDLWATTGEVDEAADVKLGEARLVRKGDDVTLVAWSGVLRAVEAALPLLRDGPSVEIIDLRTIYPWDREMVIGSVRRTGRLLIVHEAVATGGCGASARRASRSRIRRRWRRPARSRRRGLPIRCAPWCVGRNVILRREARSAEPRRMEAAALRGSRHHGEVASRPSRLGASRLAPQDDGWPTNQAREHLRVTSSLQRWRKFE